MSGNPTRAMYKLTFKLHKYTALGQWLAYRVA